VKLYDFEAAPSPRRVRMVLAEKGLAVERIQVDLRKGEQLGEAFRRINPQATVPVLELDDGQRLTEGLAIAVYLDETHPEPPLFGTTPLERARTFEWTARLEHEFLLPVADVVRNGHPAFLGRALPGPFGHDQIPELAERGCIRAARFLDVLEQRLAESPFVGGARFGFADITAVVGLDLADRVELGPKPAQSHLRAWRDQMKARPSFAA
jgi:glutathione S-transferase